MRQVGVGGGTPNAPGEKQSRCGVAGTPYVPRRGGKAGQGTPDVQRRGHLDAPGSVQGISHSTGLLYLSAPDLMRATGMMMWDLRLGLALSQSGQRAKKHGTPPLPV